MSDDHLFWLGFGAATCGLAVSLAALFWPQLRWLIERRRRSGRMGYLR